MSRQTWQELYAAAVADGSAIANTTTETVIFPGIAIDANYFQDARAMRILAYGRHSTTATPTLTFRLRWAGVGGTVMAASGAITCGSAVTAAMWALELIVVTRANGSSGSLFTTGKVIVGEDAANTVGSATNASAVGLMGSAGVATPAAVTLDLTAAPSGGIVLTAQWSAASASNTLTGHQLLVESLN
jgi:hypothetical protein